MNPQPGCLPVSLVLAFSAFFISFFLGCAKENNDAQSDGNSTAAAPYPLDYCLVSGNDIGEEGSDMVPYSHTHEGKVINFCCKPCLPRFEKDPAKYLAVLQEEIDHLNKQPEG